MNEEFPASESAVVRIGGRAIAVLLALTWFTRVGLGASEPTDRQAGSPAPQDFSAPPLDPAFAAGFARVKKTSGLRDPGPMKPPTNWVPNLGVIIGFRTDVGAKRFVNLVEITTLAPPAEESSGRPDRLPEAELSFTATWTNRLQTVPRVHRFTSPKYPIRVRVFDEQGSFLKESHDQLSWEFLTNRLVDACDWLHHPDRLFADATRRMAERMATLTNRPPNQETLSSILSALSKARSQMDRSERVLFGGVVAIVSLFSEIQSAEALDVIRDHAFEVVRSPNFLKILVQLKLDLRLTPRFEKSKALPPRTDAPGEPRVWLPVVLSQGDRLLTTVDFVSGPPDGVYSLTAGVRALRATHPTKPDRHLLAQVLAVGTVPDPVPERR